MGTDDNEELVMFGSYDNAVDASMVKGVLESNGVPCMLTNQVMSSVLPLSPISMGLVKLMVFKRDLPLAEKIMQSKPLNDNDANE